MTLDVHRRLAGIRPPAEVLEAAAERAAVALQVAAANAADEDQARPRATQQLARLLEALGRMLNGEAAEVVGARLASDGAMPTVLATLERELLDGPRELESAPGTLEILGALAQLRSVLAADRPRHSAAQVRSDEEDLRARMREADAYELLVEAAHDFRSPLTSILFLAETLRDGHSGEVNDLQRSQLGLMYSAAFGLAAVASDIMDLARQEKGLLQDEPEAFGLAEVFHNVVRMVQPIAEEKGLELRVVVPDHGRAAGHAHALGRVLLNLTTNALKFTHQGSVELGVRRLPHNRIEYYVQDTGRGIPEDRQKDLFQPFKRRLGESQQGHFFSGSGVGLSIARRLVEAMGGTLEFETSDEHGTRFSFSLPQTPRPD